VEVGKGKEEEEEPAQVEAPKKLKNGSLSGERSYRTPQRSLREPAPRRRKSQETEKVPLKGDRTGRRVMEDLERDPKKPIPGDPTSR